jgi:ketosteroid isomerase-like protein
MATAHPNAIVARRLWEAFGDGDVARLRELLTPDVLWRSHGSNPYSGEVKGIEAVLDLMARSGESVDELRSVVREIFASDAGAVVWATTNAARGPKILHIDFLLLLRIADGRIYEVSSVPTDQRHNDEFWRLQ